MIVLTGVLGCRTLRRTVQVRLGSNPPAVARWHSHLHGLATAIHEIDGLGLQNEDFRFRPEFHDFRKQSKIFYSIIHSDVGFSVQLLCFFPDTRNLTPDT